MEMTVSDDTKPLILLVEDSERNVRLMREILQGNGYRVAVAADGFQAIETARNLQPCLILMDVQLPRMDGLTATGKLRQDPATADIPIVALTAHAMPEHRQQAVDAGCSSYISKPISYRSFLDEIAELLAQTRRAASPREIDYVTDAAPRT